MYTPTASARRHDLTGPAAVPARYAMRRVATREDWAAVRSLRFWALRRHGDIPAAAVPAWGDGHDCAPEARTFLLVRDGTPIASTRSNFAAPGAPCPAMDAYASDIGRALAAGSALVEASLTVVHPDEPDPATATLHLFKAQMLLCAALDADWLLAAVRDTQMGFYRRVFGMEILSGAERVPGMALSRVLMGLRYRDHAARLFGRLPILRVSGADQRHFEASGEVRLHGESAPPCEEACAGAPSRP